MENVMCTVKRFFLPVVFLLSCTMVQTFAGSNDRAQPFIVSTEWLAQHLSDPKLVLIHIGERGQFDSVHIPGAQFLSRDQISTPRGEGLTLELPPVAHLDSVFENYGISNDSRIILYWGKDWMSPTARVFLTLDYLGLGDRTSILDGGMPVWISEGRKVTNATAPPKRGTFTPHPRPEVIAHLDWLKEKLENPTIKVLDSRTPNFFAGKDTGMASRAGHIPGARNLPFVDVADEQGKFKNTQELKKLFVAKGVTDNTTVVTYCHIGQQASLVYFVARSLGYDAKLYDGSFEEWSKHKELPVVREEKKH